MASPSPISEAVCCLNCQLTVQVGTQAACKLLILTLALCSLEQLLGVADMASCTSAMHECCEWVCERVYLRGGL